MKNFNVSNLGIRKYHKEVDYVDNKVVLIDWSKNKDSNLYMMYDISLVKDFIENMVDILEELYDNNEFVIFNLYFIEKLSKEFKLDDKGTLIYNGKFTVDIPELVNHFSKYPMQFLYDNIVDVYSKSGLVSCKSILVRLSNCDRNNLRDISKSIFLSIARNLNKIDSGVGNNKINYIPCSNFDDIFLLIAIDRDHYHWMKDN